MLESALQEILDKVSSVEGKVSNKDFQRELSNRLKEVEEQLHTVQSQIDNLVERLVPRGPGSRFWFFFGIFDNWEDSKITDSDNRLTINGSCLLPLKFKQNIAFPKSLREIE